VTFHVPEPCRVKRGPQASSSRYGNNGAFSLPAVVPGRSLWCIASDGEGWEHVSVSVRQGGKTRMPTWDEMCAVKAAFWDGDDVVMQLHPRASEYVNFEAHCLHLWRPVAAVIPTPHHLLVGPKTREELDALQAAAGMALTPAAKAAILLAVSADGGGAP
jgi:hypothetical protein